MNNNSEIQSIILSEEYDILCQEYITTLYQGESGFISYNPGEKETAEKEKAYLTYGEILYPSVTVIIDYLGDITRDDIFYDLGSGTGKVGLQLFLKTPVKAVHGIEYSEARHQIAERVYAQVRTEFPSLFANNRILESKASNFITEDFREATIIYCCCTAFSEELVTVLGSSVDRCPNIRHVITTKKIACKLPLVATLDIECTWDKTRCYVYSSSKTPETTTNEI